MINLVMLDQAQHSPHIIFRSRPALQKALEFYLNFPAQSNGIYSPKTISARPDDQTLLFLRKLETIVTSLGSDVKAKYHIDQDEDASFDEIVAQVLSIVEPVGSAVPIALLMNTLVQVLIKLDLTVPAVHMLDQMFQDNTSCALNYPDRVFQVIQEVNPSVLTEYTKRIKEFGLRDWHMAWYGLVKYSPSGHDSSSQFIAASRHFPPRKAEDVEVDSQGDVIEKVTSQGHTPLKLREGKQTSESTASARCQADRSGISSMEDSKDFGPKDSADQLNSRSVVDRHTHGTKPSEQGPQEKNSMITNRTRQQERSHADTSIDRCAPLQNMLRFYLSIIFSFFVLNWVMYQTFCWLAALLEMCFGVPVRLFPAAGQR